ncbi:hypothetical protein EJ419_06885 [Alloscardovia theropitheci]|uniref:Uncharacterized protein n=1 Tax=Alloscardovia theropitheci TaxID=2496842 RepID=A0A4R0QNC9_9BIFI|nr:hypothetical protein [Alloscardovia theropitheci]TCD53692.1 hypothetical protein EJ419_06885 [Alloscardovia theropitheci]
MTDPYKEPVYGDEEKEKDYSNSLKSSIVVLIFSFIFIGIYGVDAANSISDFRAGSVTVQAYMCGTSRHNSRYGRSRIDVTFCAKDGHVDERYKVTIYEQDYLTAYELMGNKEIGKLTYYPRSHVFVRFENL